MKWYDEIAKIARELYEKSGKREGYDLDNWLEAERIVMARHREEEKLEAESSSSPKKKNALTRKRIIKKTEKKQEELRNSPENRHSVKSSAKNKS